jgi:fibronectin type 3 domain-containing protein
MNNIKRQFMILNSNIFVLMIVVLTSTASASAVQGNIWTTKASMATERNVHQAVEVNGKIYAIGGNDGKAYLNSVEEYNPQTNKWITKASMTDARYDHQVAVVDEKIYVIGGYNSSGDLNSVEEYDPTINKWTTKASMNTARRYPQVVAVGGKIYAIGGYNNGCLNSVEEYDPAKNTWTARTPMGTERYHFATSVVDGKIYAIGGYNNGCLNSVEEYDPAKNTWTARTPMGTGRYFFAASVIDGKIYAIGGYDGKNSLNSVEEYNPATNIWVTRASMVTARYKFEVVLADKKMYAIGGNDGKSYLNSVEEYNLEQNTWKARASMTNARGYFQAAFVNEKIYAIGGYNGSNVLNSVEEYRFEYPAPANFTATVGSIKVNLSWTASQNATSYIIKRSEKSGGTYTKIATVQTSNYTDTSVTNGTTYYYVVSAVKNDVESPDTAEVSAKPEDIAKATTKLTAVAGDAKVNLIWTVSENATGYNIKRSTTAGGPYTTIATSSAITYTDATAVSGTTYYYVVTAINSTGESENSNEVSSRLANLDVSLEVASADKTKVGEFITANVVIHNASNICAEDIKVVFDTSKLELVGSKGTEGIMIYKEDSLTSGTRRYITASLGKANAANGDKILLQLTFKAKASGEAKIDITNGRIADNATLEKDIEEKSCGEKIVLVEEKTKDVNRSGEFTLLDLGIDAWYYGDAAANTDISKYDADVVANGTIDDDDLAEIVKQILGNSNYPAASK